MAKTTIQPELADQYLKLKRKLDRWSSPYRKHSEQTRRRVREYQPLLALAKAAWEARIAAR